MAEYIDRNHFDERIRVAVGMSEGDLSNDFKDGVLFVLELLKTEDSADVIERSKIDKAIEEIEIEYNNLDHHANKLLGSSHGMRRALEILKRNIGE